jgi:hypothetical protein
MPLKELRDAKSYRCFVRWHVVKNVVDDWLAKVEPCDCQGAHSIDPGARL